MDPRDSIESGQLDMLNRAFADQLMACLQECAGGRKGLFSNVELLDEESGQSAWPEAARLRELAVALQALLSQHEQSNPLCDEFLDLCTMHGESHPGEPKLARTFLQRIEGGEVGDKGEKLPW